MTQIGNLDPAVQPLAMKAAGLREQNAKFAQQLEELGAGVEISTARVEHALVFLTDVGVITEMQRWEEAIAWELTLREQLQAVIVQVKQIKADAEEARKAEERRRRLLLP